MVVIPGFAVPSSVTQVNRGLSGENFASAEPQHEHDGAAQHQFERGPEHAHQANQFQAAANVFLVLAFRTMLISASSCT